MSRSRLTLDRTHFPMVWVDSIQAFMSCLPVTKIQFEYFLCETSQPRFDAAMYEDLLKTSPRISPGRALAKDYWKLFLTGIRPSEALAFASWMGENGDAVYELPSRDEWYDGYEELSKTPPLATAEYEELGIFPRTAKLFERLQLVTAKGGDKRSMADMMLLRHGVFEWVDCDGQRWGGAGLPHAELGGGIVNLASRNPIPAADVDSRHKAFGFRLIKREL